MIFNMGEINKAITLAFEDAAKDTLATMSERIFIDGETSSEQDSGSYSTEPFYANAQTSPKKPNKKGKTGKKIKGGYYPGGYKEFRNQQGRESAFVNYRLSGDLQSDFNNSKSGFRLNKLGKLQYGIEIDKVDNIDKVRGLEAKYGTVFTSLSKSEENLFINSLQFNLNQRLPRR